MMKTEADSIKKLYETYVMPTYAQSIVLARGRGTKVWDADGNEYLDFLSGISVTNVGHSHPVVIEAVNRQMQELSHVSNLYYHENQARLAEKIALVGLGGKSFFCNSGAEANEGLIKLARLWGRASGKHEVVSMRNSFHGRTLATAAATGQTKIQEGFEPMPEGFRYADFNDIKSIESAVNGKTAAVLVEAIQGEGGIIPAAAGFMKDLRTLCAERKILMLCDEVQCGMARTGRWFGFQNYGVEPDAFSLAKGLGSGYPIGACVASPAFSDVFKPGKHATTFGGGPVACAAALATIRVIEEENLLERAARAGAALLKGLQSLAGAHEQVVGARGVGLMLGLVLDRPAKPYTDMMLRKGLLTLATADKVIRLLPPLNVSDAEADRALEIMDECLKA